MEHTMSAKTEIKITPQMVEAGKQYLQDAFDLSNETAVSMASALFRVMLDRSDQAFPKA
jgi:hypothetical protein